MIDHVLFLSKILLYDEIQLRCDCDATNVASYFRGENMNDVTWEKVDWTCVGGGYN